MIKNKFKFHSTKEWQFVMMQDNKINATNLITTAVNLNNYTRSNNTYSLSHLSNIANSGIPKKAQKSWPTFSNRTKDIVNKFLDYFLNRTKSIVNKFLAHFWTELRALQINMIISTSRLLNKLLKVKKTAATKGLNCTNLVMSCNKYNQSNLNSPNGHMMSHLAP